MEKIGKIDYSRKFVKSLKRSPLKVKKNTRKRIGLFARDPFNPRLNNHKLRGRYRKYRSINITGDLRALYSERMIKGKRTVVFEVLGTHSELYK